MRYEPRFPTGKRWREELRAERVLADMDLFDDLAELHDTEACPNLQREFADRYRKLIGVDPQQREPLRTAMTHALETLRSDAPTELTVAAVIERVRREHQTNGSGLDGAESVAGNIG